jgi:hypothetical protein
MHTNFARFPDARAPGLLEQPVLLVAPADPAGRRWIEDSQGQVAGFAWRPSLGPRWLRWLLRTVVVHEADEEPVVFQVQRQWTLLPRWLVADADGEVVGTLAGAWLLDRWGDAVLRCCPRADGSGGVFEANDGQKAAEWSTGGDRLHLVFHPLVHNDPFLKMLILAALLLA